MIRLDAAACQSCDPELFHPFPKDRGAIDAARAICAGCAIRLDCLALALSIPDAQGIWGGMTEPERALHRKHQSDNGTRA
jgi:WhiB family transcriptional regulator, redox-sensing transcriptional regulator